MKAKLRLVGVELPRALVSREPYISTIALTGKTGGSIPLSLVPAYPKPETPAVPGAAEGETAPNPPALQGETAQIEGATTILTEPAAGIRRGNPLVLDLVLFEGDPGPWLFCRGVVMESDQGERKAGQRLDEARHAVDATGLGQALVSGISQATGVAGALLEEATGVILNLLKANGDDTLAHFEIRIIGADDFRARAGEFKVETPTCTVTFHLEVEGLPEVVATPVLAATTVAPAANVVVDEATPEGTPTGRMSLDGVVAKLAPAPEGATAQVIDSGEPVPATGAIVSPAPEQTASVQPATTTTTEKPVRRRDSRDAE